MTAHPSPIRAWRLAAGLTARACADACRLPLWTYRRLEAGTWSEEGFDSHALRLPLAALFAARLGVACSAQWDLMGGGRPPRVGNMGDLGSALRDGRRPSSTAGPPAGPLSQRTPAGVHADHFGGGREGHGTPQPGRLRRPDPHRQ